MTPILPASLGFRQCMLNRLSDPVHKLEQMDKTITIWKAEELEAHLKEGEIRAGKIERMTLFLRVIIVATAALCAVGVACHVPILSIAIAVQVMAFATLTMFGIRHYLYHSQKRLEAKFDAQAVLACWRIKQVHREIQDVQNPMSQRVLRLSVQDGASVAKQTDRLLSILPHLTNRDPKSVAEGDTKVLQEVLAEIDILANLLDFSSEKFIEEEQNTSLERLIVAAMKGPFVDQLVPALLSLRFPGYGSAHTYEQYFNAATQAPFSCQRGYIALSALVKKAQEEATVQVDGMRTYDPYLYYLMINKILPYVALTWEPALVACLLSPLLDPLPQPPQRHKQEERLYYGYTLNQVLDTLKENLTILFTICDHRMQREINGGVPLHNCYGYQNWNTFARAAVILTSHSPNQLTYAEEMVFFFKNAPEYQITRDTKNSMRLILALTKQGSSFSAGKVMRAVSVMQRSFQASSNVNRLEEERKAEVNKIIQTAYPNHSDPFCKRIRKTLHTYTQDPDERWLTQSRKDIYCHIWLRTISQIEQAQRRQIAHYLNKEDIQIELGPTSQEHSLKQHKVRTLQVSPSLKTIFGEPALSNIIIDYLVEPSTKNCCGCYSCTVWRAEQAL